MKTATVCHGHSFTGMNAARCTRGVLGVWLPLLISKALFAGFGQPAMLLFVVSSSRLQKWLLWVVLAREEQEGGKMVAELTDEYFSLLTWIEIALVFGPFCPLLLALVALSLFTNQWAYNLALRLLHAQGYLPRAS